MRMTVDGSGDDKVMLQGLGHVTFVDETAVLTAGIQGKKMILKPKSSQSALLTAVMFMAAVMNEKEEEVEAALLPSARRPMAIASPTTR